MDKFMPKLLSGNQLKIIAAISMTIDHVGLIMFPEVEIFRIIGRLALPIFAYMIAEGCVHTKSRIKYILLMLTVAIVCQAVYFVTLRSIEQSILTTFLMSALLIFSYDNARKKQGLISTLLFVLIFVGVFVVCETLPKRLDGFHIDYGFWGVLLPFLIYLGKNRAEKLLLCAIGLFALTETIVGVQGYSFLALIPLFFYSGKRGKLRMKYFFYIYYPLHLGVIHLISML